MLYGRFPCFFHRIISPTQTTILNIIIIEHVQRRWCYNDASKEQLNLKLCEIVCIRLRVCVCGCASRSFHTHILFTLPQNVPCTVSQLYGLQNIIFLLSGHDHACLSTTYLNRDIIFFWRSLEEENDLLWWSNAIYFA